MSQFDHFCEHAADDSAGVFGMVTALIQGIEVQGVLDVIALDRSLALGGESASAPANLVIPPQEVLKLSGLAEPLERTLDNTKMTIGDREYRILKVMIDAAGITLMLDDSQR